MAACPPTNGRATPVSRTEVTMKRLFFIAILGILVFPPYALCQRSQSAKKYVKQGIQSFSHGDIDGALADFDRAIGFDPGDADAYFKRGRAFLIEGNVKFAIADFDKSISLDDRNPLVYAERGLARQTEGKADEAQKDFERGLKLNHDLRLMLDMHLLDLQMQMKEMRRRQAAFQKNIA